MTALKSARIIRDALAAALAVFAIYVAYFGIFDIIYVYGTTVLLGALVGFLTVSDKHHAPGGAGVRRLVVNVALALALVWLMWKWIGVMLAQEGFFIEISRLDYLSAWAAFALIGYLTWRFFGATMLIVYAAAILYAMAPEAVGGRAIDWTSFADRMWFDYDGVFGRPVHVVATTVLIFIVFGAVLQASGAGAILLKIAFAATGRFAGGPAHAAIVGSAMFGTMSGAAVANVVSTGIFTIPIIKRAGFKPKFAGAVEAAASTGGQIMPPVMGVVAFIMADVTGIAYLNIVVAALIPAIFYYLSLFIVVQIEARKQGVGATPLAEREVLTRSDWLKSIAFWVPLATIILALMNGYTPQKSGAYALIAATLLCLALFPEFRHPRQWWQALVSAGMTSATLMVIVASVGLVIGVVNMTGVGLSFANGILALAGDSLFLGLFLVMIGCLVMGMGVPTVTAYLILALVMGPVLENMGVPKIAAHLFMVYFGVLSVITPPVALAAFAAAPIAGSKPMETGVEAVRLAIAGFIIPYVFVFHTDILIIDGVSASGFIWGVGAFLVSTWSVATAFSGFDARPLAMWERAGRLAAGVAVLVPVAEYSLPAGAIALGLVAMHRAQVRSSIGKSEVQ